MQIQKLASELLSTLWFLLVAVAFFAPLLGRPLPTSLPTALYGVVLLVSVVALARSLLAKKGEKNHVE